ncbi:MULTISPECIES: hypothetical protein [Bradyrhizobium]|uniref:Uncharacterized protein n=1 Tax=Bradyrhizobium elkanii TaxID=29448 RepID=A0A4U6S271_BRAEL|nr:MULTISPECIES: hypothetical protein [Bradyrhizobium]MTV16037.1 hypothetical protein [Bradyrhizobium sp. BR2003]TKV81777.1 hypothetical protein FDV58_08890 [Bradyrhizobium elkanii]
MLEFLIVVVVAGIGFISGYGVRDLISRRRRWSAPWRHAPRVRTSRRQPSASHDDAADAVTLIAANDDNSARGRRWTPHAQKADHTAPPDELDGAVRELLGELGRRTARPSSTPHRRRQ